VVLIDSFDEISFFNTSGVAKVYVPPTMDVTMDIGIRNLRFCAVCSKHENDWMVRRY